MVDDRGRRWRWSNVPIPEQHVVGLVGGTVLHLLRPWRAFETRRTTRVVGATLVGFGLLLVGWAVRTTGEQDVEHPPALVTAGPYAVSRNPMYVAWTALYVGVAFLVNTTWLFLGLPAVVATTHSLVRREERALELTYGDEYRTYRRDARRYL